MSSARRGLSFEALSERGSSRSALSYEWCELTSKVETVDKGRCSKCSRALSGQVAVSLWDGKRYCRECVEAACPGLADYARNASILGESIASDLTPTRGHRFFNFLTCVVLMLVASAAVFGASWEEGAGFRREKILAGLAWVGLFFVPVILALWLSMVWSGAGPSGRATRRAALAVRDGRVHVRAKSGMAVSASSASLEECSWYVGPSTDDPCARTLDLPEIEAVLLIVPRLRVTKGVEQRTVACGWTPQIQRIWIGFLTLAGVPRRQ